MIRLALLFVLAALPALAQQVGVLSGEHPDFTRLAFVLEEPAAWEFGRIDTQRRGQEPARQDRVYEMRLAREGVTLDIADVFSRVPRSRLAALSVPGDGRLRLQVAPGHRAVPFDLPGGVVVIDIRSGPPPEDSPFEASLPPDRAQTDRVAASAVIDTGSRVSAGPQALQPGTRDWSEYLWHRRLAPEGSAQDPASLPRAARPTRSRPTLPVPEVLATVLPGSALAGLERPIRPTEGAGRPAAPGPRRSEIPLAATDLAGAQSLILQQIARASAQGLVTATGPDLPDLIVEADPPEAVPPAPPPDPAPGPRANAQMNVTARTSIDRDSFARVRAALAGGTQTCPAPEALDVAGWGRGEDPAALIAGGRVALLGEFDRVSAAAVGDLARRYLHLGFGAEAAALLRSFPGLVTESDQLLALAAVMEGRLPPRGAEILRMAGCDSPAALWSLLSRAPGEAVPGLDLGAVRRSFAALPAHLREHLAAAVVERLITLGEIDAATSVRNAVGRVLLPGDTRVGLIDVRLSLLAPKKDAGFPQAEERLIKAMGGDGPEAVPALLLYLDERLNRGLPVTPAFAEQAAALALEHRDAPDGPALMRAEVLAHAASGDFKEAFAAFTRARSRAGKCDNALREAEAATWGPLFDLLVTKASDVVFLDKVLETWQADPRRPEVPSAVATRLSERLLALGFGAQARRLRQAQGATDDETRLFLARADLAEDRPREALRGLGGLEGDEADRLRARALAAIGDTPGAIATYDRLAETEEAAQVAWRAGDWDSYRRLRSDPRGDALRRIGGGPGSGVTGPALDGAEAAAPVPTPDPNPDPAAGPQAAPAEEGEGDPLAKVGSDGVLARNRALLEQSRAMRAALADLRATLPPLPGDMARGR